MEILFSVEGVEVKRAAPQWEQRMWERCLLTSRLRVSQTADDIAYQRLPQRFKP